MRGLSLVVARGGHSSSRCAGLSLSRPLLLRSISSRRAGSVVVAHGPSCSAACGIFPDQGSNPCPLHWQADSQPLRHQGSPGSIFCLIQWELPRIWGVFAHRFGGALLSVYLSVLGFSPSISSPSGSPKFQALSSVSVRLTTFCLPPISNAPLEKSWIDVDLTNLSPSPQNHVVGWIMPPKMSTPFVIKTLHMKA